ncbi:MAG: site-specific integrase, partial [Actinomycetota bacterium]|nr:site-specific integrase [Actinomycetota bacterium]
MPDAKTRHRTLSEGRISTSAHRRDARHRQRSRRSAAAHPDHRSSGAPGLRISEALALNESDLDLQRGAILVRRGKGGKRREVGMDRWAWEQLDPWLRLRATLPFGALFCVLRGPTAGRSWAPAGVRSQLNHAAASAGVRRRFAPHQLRHAHALEMSREGVPLLIIQRQLGHADLAITSVYLRGIDN